MAVYLWSRVDNSHTHLVRLVLDDETIPAVAYQCVMAINGRGYLHYCHKSDKLYVCLVCAIFKNPKEYGILFHVQGRRNRTSLACPVLAGPFFQEGFQLTKSQMHNIRKFEGRINSVE